MHRQRLLEPWQGLGAPSLEVQDQGLVVQVDRRVGAVPLAQLPDEVERPVEEVRRLGEPAERAEAEPVVVPDRRKRGVVGGEQVEFGGQAGEEGEGLRRTAQGDEAVPHVVPEDEQASRRGARRDEPLLHGYGLLQEGERVRGPSRGLQAHARGVQGRGQLRRVRGVEAAAHRQRFRMPSQRTGGVSGFPGADGGREDLGREFGVVARRRPPSPGESPLQGGQGASGS